MYSRNGISAVALLIGLCASAAVQGATTHATVATSRIKGTATYRERVALTRGALLEATLEEIAGPRASTQVLALVRKLNPGQVPLAFEIPFDLRRLEATRRYVVRVTIRDRGQLRFTGSTAFPVVPVGHPDRVTVFLRSVAAAGPGLENTRWRPVQIGDRLVNVADAQHEPWIELESRSKRLTGSGGCNRISGGYTTGRDTLRFGRIVSTQMACTAMGTESALLRALNRTRSYRLRGRVLELKDGRGRVLARLEERNLD